MPPETNRKYQTICENICLNLPEQSLWQWDPKFKTSIIVFNKFDQDLVFFPITQEFDHRWDFSSIDRSGNAFYEFFINRFGIIPGQVIFTSDRHNGWILFAVWWPWGNNEKISLRVGLFADDDKAAVGDEQIRAWLTKWFKLESALRDKP